MTAPYHPLASSDHREYWLQQRRTGIGASDVSAVLHCNPWKPAITLWAEKTGQIEEDDLNENEAVFWGQQLEDAIIDGYQKRAQRPAIPFGVLLRSAGAPWLLGTPDAITTDSDAAARHEGKIRDLIGAVRIVLDGSKEGEESARSLAETIAELSKGWWPLQVKNSGLRQSDAWEEGPPDYYVCQAQQESIVFGSEARATVCALLGGQQLAWSDVDVDSGSRQRITKLTQRFWEGCVLGGKMPDPDGRRESLEALAKIWPEEDPKKQIDLPERVELPPDVATVLTGVRHTEPIMANWDQLESYYEAIEETKREAKKASVTFKELVARHLGDAVQGTSITGHVWTFKTVNRKSYTVAATSYRKISRKKPKKR